MKKKTLFLDRDGVINRQIINGYVTDVTEFEFLPGVKEALALLADRFDYIFIVTNQQGIGKGIFTSNTLKDIHNQMVAEIQTNGGRIDKIYYCPNLEKDNSPLRKPAPGMGIKAKEDFPDLDLSEAFMIGDTISDMQFGRNLGVKTIYLHNNKCIPAAIDKLADEVYSDLREYAASI